MEETRPQRAPSGGGLCLLVNATAQPRGKGAGGAQQPAPLPPRERSEPGPPLVSAPGQRGRCARADAGGPQRLGAAGVLSAAPARRTSWGCGAEELWPRARVAPQLRLGLRPSVRPSAGAWGPGATQAEGLASANIEIAPVCPVGRARAHCGPRFPNCFNGSPSPLLAAARPWPGRKHASIPWRVGKASWSRSSVINDSHNWFLFPLRFADGECKLDAGAFSLWKCVLH